jgi:uncharacterized radical SAM protein YgiQ
MGSLQDIKPLFSYRPFWAKKLGTAPVLPMSRREMDALGWDSCDIIIVSGDAYVDHPSFGMAIIGRLLEAQGFRVGIIAQPDWESADAFKVLGKPNLFFGITAGNMDSMVNRYTSDRKVRSDDAYTPGGEGGKRPDRAVLVYAQRAREAFKGVPIVIGGIEASLRRIAHYDYWSDTVRRSILPDSKADMLLYGNAERAVVELAHRIAAGEKIKDITDIRGTAFMRSQLPAGWGFIDSSSIDKPGKIQPEPDPYQARPDCESRPDNQAEDRADEVQLKVDVPVLPGREETFIRLPSYEQVKSDKILYAHTSRVFHLETNPGNARVLVQRHGNRDVWMNPPPVPLSTEELDPLYEFSYTRRPHPVYGNLKNPAWEMIRFSINIMRGCFGGCTFCSITEHEGRIIQSRSEDSVAREVETIRDEVPEFTGFISDLGGPTANMYRLLCKDKKIEESCRRLSCVYPKICKNLGTNHQPLINLYRRIRNIKGVKKVVVASGLRYDLAIESPEYVKELVTHHVGGYLKIAPEHTEDGPLSKMMKPGIGSYDRFKQLFDRYSKQAGKEQYLIPYFIAAHPGTTDEDMLKLALWLKKNKFRPDQVQAFLPTPMAVASAMYYTEYNPLGRIREHSRKVTSIKGLRQRRLHKAFLRYHDPRNWPILREALHKMGRTDLVGRGEEALVPDASYREKRNGRSGGGFNRSNSFTPARTTHTRAEGKRVKRRRR